MNWQDIVKNAELVYASVSEDTGFRTWSLKKTICDVAFYDEYPVEDFDKIVCTILNNHNNSLEENRFATILGFNVIDNFDVSPIRYADKAELDVFKAIIQTVIEWGLVIKEDDKYIFTELGQKALEAGKKYKFYSGCKALYENHSLKTVDTDDNLFFPFNSALGVFSEITDKKSIHYSKVNLEEVFLSEKTALIKRHLLQSKENHNIFFSEETQYFTFESCNVDIRLYKKNEEYFPIVFYQDKISVQATGMLHKPENVGQKDKIIEWGLYLKLIKDPNARLDYETIIPFEDLLEIDTLIKDKRLVWSDNSLFILIAENSNANQWFSISNNCPIEIIKLHLDEFRERLDWTSLSLRIDDEFLIQKATHYPWNFEAISAKKGISIEVIKTLLLIPELKNQEWDWNNIMPQLDFEFVKTHIDKVDFELFELTKTNIHEVQPLIKSYPSKRWDWSYISTDYDLSYILDNIIGYSTYLDIVEIVNRAFTSKDYVLPFCRSQDFIEVLTDAKESKLSNFSPNQANYFWSKTLIELLESTGYLSWESGNYTLGFECNPYIEWTYDFFKEYHSKITSQRGCNFLSSQILDTQIITDFIKFNWNWDLVSSNSNLIKDSFFILSVKDKLNYNILLSEIQGDNLEAIFEEANVLSFLEENPDKWTNVTEKPSKEFILKHIDYTWDWQVLTRRFYSTIKIDTLGNKKWIDKWDWKYLTHNLDISIVSDKLDLYLDYWDWEYLSNTLDKVFIINNLPDYNEYWNWEILLNDRLSNEDLQLYSYLPRVAACISVFDNQKIQDLWKIITCRFDYSELEQLINQTCSQEIFYWDYGYFYDLPDFNPLSYLNENFESIHWSKFSGSVALNKSFKWEKSLFSYRVWLNNILRLLKEPSYQWDFKSLSHLDSINWNDSVLSIRSSKWDWDYLSEFSKCFRKEKEFESRFHRFLKYLNFQVFSKRTDSDITEELIYKTIDNEWDWSLLSANQSVRLSLNFIKEHKDKNWDWQVLSARSDIKFENSIFIELENQGWDWNAISKRTDITFSEEFISKLHHKPFDWTLVSRNETFIPNANTLSLLNGKKLDWEAISGNPCLSLEILWDYKEDLDWKSLTKNSVIDISDIGFLNKYQEYLDWNYISQSEKFFISSENLHQFKDKLNWNVINNRKDFVISHELLEPFADVLNWSNVSQSMNVHFTEEIIEKYRNKWDWQLLKNNPQIIDRLDFTLKKYKAEFNCVHFLEQFDRIPFIYHFTHLFNAIGIIKERKILSRNKADGKFANAAGNLVERRSTAHDYARFYFRPQTPTQFYNECLGWDSLLTTSYNKSYYSQARNLGLPKCPMPIFFKFDLKEVLMRMLDSCFYSTGNMQTNWSQVKKVADEPSMLNTQHLYSSVADFENYKHYSQQEFLIKEEFDFSELDSFEIICYNSEHADILKSLLGHDPICEKINVDNWGVYHRGNRELHISQTDSAISIESEYKESAYLLIKGKDLKGLKILETENIQKETEAEIIAYPKIKFAKTEKPIEVYFVDTTIGRRDWLIFKK